MPNRKDHINFGRYVRKITHDLKRPSKRLLQDEFLEELGAEASHSTLARLPDIIEPATSPNHRGPAHSIPALVASMALTPLGHRAADKLHGLADIAKTKAHNAETPLGKWGWYVLDGAGRVGAGVVRHAAPQYAGHLLLDSLTPKGLPWK